MNRKNYIIDTFSNNLGVKSVRVTHKPTLLAFEEELNGNSLRVVRNRLIKTFEYLYPSLHFK